MKRMTAILLLVAMLCAYVSGANAGEREEGIADLNEIFASYAGKEVVLSDQIQIVHNQVNFRKSPGGKVLGRLQGGAMLTFLDETQHKGELWYHAYAEEYGKGYVMAEYAKPVWNGQNYWEAMAEGKCVSDNMLLYAYWMGTYQIDHGLSFIETMDGGRYPNIAPLSVRGNEALIPADMRIQMVTKLYEYGLICYQAYYQQLQDSSVSLEEKKKIASTVLKNHYGTDDVWKIITRQSVVFWVHGNDLHGDANRDYSKRDFRLTRAVTWKIIDEH